MDNFNAFKIQVADKILDYRVGQNLDLEAVRNFFVKNYTVKRIWSEPRHVLGILEKNDRDYFLKLATTEGISSVTKIEYVWNEEVNNIVDRSMVKYWVPQNYESGYYIDNLFYLISEKFSGQLLCEKPSSEENANILVENIDEVINFAKWIENLNLEKLPRNKYIKGKKHQEIFLYKTNLWYQSIPQEVRRELGIEKLLEIVRRGTGVLQCKTRHGDFTPWHIFKLDNGNLGLIDGEHASLAGVENYDLCYLIQRIFSVLQKPDYALQIFNKIVTADNKNNLKTILAARAIGGFLDESLNPKPDYKFASSFLNWINGL